MLVPEFTVTHCVGSEEFSGRNQSIGRAVAWVTIASDSESGYPTSPETTARIVR